MSALASGLVKKSTAYNADPARITTRPDWNDRFDYGDIESLANGIATTLQRDPARPYATDMEVSRIDPADARSKLYDFEVVTGHRRHAATQILLGRGVEFPQGVNIYLVDRKEDTVTRLTRLFNENNKKSLLPLEEAATLKRLRDEGLTVAQICAVVGRTDVHVRETLDLLTADASVQEAVKSGKVAGSMAKIIVSVAKGDAAAQQDLIADATAAKGKDKAAKARLLQKIADKRDANAVVKGKEAKIRALTDSQLSEIGERLAKHLKALLKEAKLDPELTQEGLVEWVKADDQLAAAYVAGAMDALKAAAGVKLNLEV